jgi:hypothetical protein
VAITVQPGVRTRLGPEATVLLQAYSHGDPAALASALASAAADIAAMDGPRYVSDPMPTPDGPILLMNLGAASPRQIHAIPDILVDRIERAGVTEAVVRIPPGMGERHERVAAWTPAVRCWLRGPLVRPFGTADPAPPLWLFDLAWQWLRAEAPPGVDLVQLVASAEIPVSWDSAWRAAAAALRAGTDATLLASDFSTDARSFSVCGLPTSPAPQAALGTVGPGRAGSDVTEQMRRQRDLIRSGAAELSWAGVDVHADARDLTTWQWYDRDPGGPRRDVGMVCDMLVPDGMWYQVLSTGHLDRLGGVPAGGSVLSTGRVELAVGEPGQWLPDHPDRPALREQARSLLAGCMADPDEIHAMNQQRLHEARDRDDTGFFDSV